MEASGRDSLRSGRIPPREMDRRYPLDRPLGGLEGTYVRSGLYGETQEGTKMPVKREAHSCDSSVQVVCFKQHGDDQDVFILQCEVVMRCTGTSSTYLDRKIKNRWYLMFHMQTLREVPGFSLYRDTDFCE
jgi:hypothetical protein